MRKTLPLLFSLYCLSQLSFAQQEMSEWAGIRLSYEQTADRNIKGLNSDIGYDQWEFRAPFFYTKKQDWTFAAGLRYQSTDLDISNQAAYPLDESQLHSIDLAFFASKKYSENLDWIFLFNPNLAGDYEDVNSDALNYLTIAGVKWEQQESLQWIFGAVYTTGIGDDLFVPAIGFIWKPSSDSSLIFAGPILRYNLKLSDKWNLNLGGQFTGNRWHTKSNYGGSIEKRDFRFRSYRLFGNLEYNINERHSVYAGGGIDFGGEVELETPTTRDERDVENGGLMEIGYQFKF